MTKHDRMKFWVSMLMLFLLLIMVAFLTFIPVPEASKDLVNMTLGVFLGGGASAMPNLFGNQNAEADQLRSRVDELEHQYETLMTRHKDLSDRYEHIVNTLLARHLIPEDKRLPPSLPADLLRSAP